MLVVALAALAAAYLLGRPTVSPELTPEQQQIVNEALAMILMYGAAAAASLALSSAALIQAWVLPAVLGQPFLRLYPRIRGQVLHPNISVAPGNVALQDLAAYFMYADSPSSDH